MAVVRLLSYTGEGERLVAAAAKQTISRKPVDPWSLSEEEVSVWIRETFRRQHWSPWEFSWYVFQVECSRVCSHQLVRHRLASYAQLSQRYSEGPLRDLALRAAGLLGVECPGRPREAPGGPGAAYECYSRVLRLAAGRLGMDDLVELAGLGFVLPPGLRGAALEEAARALVAAAGEYYALRARGVAGEDARFLLPQAVKTRLIVGMNARELATSFLPLRMCTRAQWEIRLVAWRLWRELVRVHPRLFRYVGPRCVIAENTVRGEPVALEDYLEGRVGFTIPRCPELVPREGIPACLRYASRDPRGG